jgi:hypothetical protein
MITECLDSVTAAALAGAGGLIIGFAAGRFSRCGCRSRRVAPPSAAGGGEYTGEGIELYVGNLSYDMTEAELEKTFSAFGGVLSVRVIKNKFNDRSKGYGFVEMAEQNGADKAVKAMNAKEVMGRKMVVNEARSKSRE